ncbi:DUF1566 domain-containing protein [Ottowia caeni]|uniref:DUF1566 domain-containing protein n=1 Tax=Ottowia caeni TaxID=2870339 RepID=UPI001E5378EC|nr:DUF1566 domain-containing protein [Ottowia caeni]
MTIKTILLAATLLVSGCGGGTGGDTPALPLANGKAHLSSPLVGAKVQVLDSAGNASSDYGSTTTSETGTFTVPVSPALGARFRVAVSEGSYEGKPFQETLLLDVENFNPEQHLLYVNAVSTLVSRYVDRHPKTSVSEAASKVLGFLQVPIAPERAPLASDNPLQDHFRHELFLQSAQSREAPALGTYINQLLNELDAGATAHSFGRPPVGDAGSIIEKLTEELAKHLGDELFSWAFEAILSAAGVGGNAEILKELHEISAKLDELKALTTEVLSEQKQTEAEIVSVNLLNAITNIQQQYDYLTWVSQLPACLMDSQGKPVDAACARAAEATQAEVRQRITAILDSNVGVVQLTALIKASMVPSPSEVGVIQRWHDYLKTTKPFYSPIVDPRLIKIKEYYQSVQVMAANLLVEASMAQTPPDKNGAKYYLDQLNIALAAQDTLTQEMHAEDNGTILDQRSKLLWLRAPFSNLEVPATTYWGDAYVEKAGEQCKGLADSGFAGNHTWRLPSDPEFHAVVQGSPSDGTAHSGAGIFKWLGEQGFQMGGDVGWEGARGFVDGGAYFSSTMSGITGNYYSALWDDGVDYACNFVDEIPCNYDARTWRAGAWCVASGDKE